MMKKYIILSAGLLPALFIAQTGNVGVNTPAPKARLEIQSLGNTASTTALRFVTSGGTQVFKVPDNGYVSINQPVSATPAGVVDLLGNGASDLYIQNPSITTNNFLHLKYAGGGSWNNANYGGQLILFDQGLSGTNNVVARGILIAPANAAVPAGVYFGSDGSSGFSLSALPTTDLDVGGSIRVRETAEVIVAGATCPAARAGEINYYRGHFFGCNATWKQLDN